MEHNLGQLGSVSVSAPPPPSVDDDDDGFGLGAASSVTSTSSPFGSTITLDIPLPPPPLDDDDATGAASTTANTVPLQPISSLDIDIESPPPAAAFGSAITLDIPPPPPLDDDDDDAIDTTDHTSLVAATTSSPSSSSSKNKSTKSKGKKRAGKKKQRSAREVLERQLRKLFPLGERFVEVERQFTGRGCVEGSYPSTLPDELIGKMSPDEYGDAIAEINQELARALPLWAPYIPFSIVGLLTCLLLLLYFAGVTLWQVMVLVFAIWLLVAIVTLAVFVVYFVHQSRFEKSVARVDHKFASRGIRFRVVRRLRLTSLFVFVEKPKQQDEELGEVV